MIFLLDRGYRPGGQYRVHLLDDAETEAMTTDDWLMLAIGILGSALVVVAIGTWIVYWPWRKTESK